jgi:hypothetical protein
LKTCSLGRELHISDEEVRSIKLQVPVIHMAVCNIQQPTTGLKAKLGLRATAAMALLGDDVESFSSYGNDLVTRLQVRQLSEKITVVAHDDFDDYSAAIVQFKDGRVLDMNAATFRPIDDLDEQRTVVSKNYTHFANRR